MFVPDKSFQASLLFAAKAGAHLTATLYSVLSTYRHGYTETEIERDSQINK